MIYLDSTRDKKNCIINNKALIEHDAIIGDHCHIATGAIINGEVSAEAGRLSLIELAMVLGVDLEAD